jgi:hypothetical protein
MAKKKIDFKDVYYDRHIIRWVQGNNAVGLNCLASFSLRNPTKKEEKEEKKDYLKAKEIFDTHINVGQKFKPSGEKARSEVIAKITFIHNEKQSVSWKQCNMTEEQAKRGLKPAAGKWSINAMLAIHRAGNITFI